MGKGVEDGFTDNYRKQRYTNKFLVSKSFYLEKNDEEKKRLEQALLKKKKAKRRRYILLVFAFLLGVFLPIVIRVF